jgi:hypothetical protein
MCLGVSVAEVANLGGRENDQVCAVFDGDQCTR